MLVLSRFVDQEIVCLLPVADGPDQQIRISVAGIMDDSVKLKITLDRGVHDDVLISTFGEFEDDDRRLKISIIGINGAAVRLGIDADRDVTILRKELHDRGLIKKFPIPEFPRVIDEGRLIDRALGED